MLPKSKFSTRVNIPLFSLQRGRPSSASSASRLGYTAARSNMAQNSTGLTGEEIRIVRQTKEENMRAGGWVRIFPTLDSWELYGLVKRDPYQHKDAVLSE